MASQRTVKRGDFVLIGVVLALAIGLLLALVVWSGNGGAVEVTVDGNHVATLPLNIDNRLVIDGVGGQNTLIIKDGKASVTAANCPDKVCQRHRAISYTGERILCLPHKVVITVVGSTPAVDAEVGG